MQMFKSFSLSPSLYLKVYADEENQGGKGNKRIYIAIQCTRCFVAVKQVQFIMQFLSFVCPVEPFFILES